MNAKVLEALHTHIYTHNWINLVDKLDKEIKLNLICKKIEKLE